MRTWKWNKHTPHDIVWKVLSLMDYRSPMYSFLHSVNLTVDILHSKHSVTPTCFFSTDDRHWEEWGGHSQAPGTFPGHCLNPPHDLWVGRTQWALTAWIQWSANIHTVSFWQCILGNTVEPCLKTTSRKRSPESVFTDDFTCNCASQKRPP